MIERIRVAAAICLLIASTVASAAEPDRQSLIDAWAAYMPTTAGTVAFELRDDGVYYIEDENLPYEGELRLIGAIVRPAEIGTDQMSFSHMGMVEFELVGLPEERLQTQSYYYWLADRQSLHYSEVEQAWLGPEAYRAAFQDFYVDEGSFGALTFMLNYGIWILLIALVLWVFTGLHKHNKKARTLMDDSASINEQARKNLDRSEKMQKETIEIMRRSLELQCSGNELLAQIRDSLKR